MANGRAWTSDELATLRRLVAAGLTDAAIGEALCRCRATISQKRRALGLQAGQNPTLTATLARINHRRLVARGAGR